MKKTKTNTRNNNGALPFALPCGCSTWKEGGDWMLHFCDPHRALYSTEVSIRSMAKLEKEVLKTTLNSHMAREYNAIVRQAKRFTKQVDGDFSFAKPEVNFLCVEHMTMGWIYAQPWFNAAVDSTLALYPRESVANMVNDIALQAATDATHGIKRFKY